MVLAVVSVSLASLVALAAEAVSAVEAADVVEVVEAVDVADVVAAASVVKIDSVHPCRMLCRGFCSSNMRHKGQIAVHTMIMTVNEGKGSSASGGVGW